MQEKREIYPPNIVFYMLLQFYMVEEDNIVPTLTGHVFLQEISNVGSWVF